MHVEEIRLQAGYTSSLGPSNSRNCEDPFVSPSLYSCATVKARNNALGGNVSKHPKTGQYVGPGCYLRPDVSKGLMDEFFHGYQHSMFYTKNMCTCIPAVQDVRSCEYTQPPHT